MAAFLPVLSLFSGAGGLDLGFEQAGFCPLLAIDISAAAVETYNANRSPYREIARTADLGAVKPETVLAWWESTTSKGVRPVGIIGGPPCQAFSRSNAFKLDGDPRGTLPLAYAKILRAFNERYQVDFFVFENVTGLSYKAHSPALAAFQSEFASAGFWTAPPIYLDAADFGVPQRRRRMFIAGFHAERFRGIAFNPPEGGGTPKTVRDAIGGLPEPLYFSRTKRPSHAGLHPNHWCMRPRSPKFMTDGALIAGDHAARSFRRLRWNAPSWTVAYGHREVHVHPDGKRRLSVYEAMLLQGFPRERYELKGTLSQQIQLVSDAVPPPLAYRLAQCIRETIEGYQPLPLANVQSSDNGHAAQFGLWGVQIAAPRSTSA